MTRKITGTILFWPWTKGMYSEKISSSTKPQTDTQLWSRAVNAQFWLSKTTFIITIIKSLLRRWKSNLISETLFLKKWLKVKELILSRRGKLPTFSTMYRSQSHSLRLLIGLKCSWRMLLWIQFLEKPNKHVLIPVCSWTKGISFTRRKSTLKQSRKQLAISCNEKTLLKNWTVILLTTNSTPTSKK